MMQFDHIAVAAATLAEAIEHVESALGVKMQPGGEHAVFHTHNTLLGLEEGCISRPSRSTPPPRDPTAHAGSIWIGSRALRG